MKKPIVYPNVPKLSTELWGMPEAREWDVELPKGVLHATEWIAAGIPACVDGGSAPLGVEGPQQFRTRHFR
jgi:hypothetical protein